MHLCPFCNRRTINLLDDDDDEDSTSNRPICRIKYTSTTNENMYNKLHESFQMIRLLPMTFGDISRSSDCFTSYFS